MKERTKQTNAHAKSSRTSGGWKHVHGKAAAEMKGCLDKAIAAARVAAERNLADRSRALAARVDEAKGRLSRASAKLRKGPSHTGPHATLQDTLKGVSGFRTASLRQLESANAELEKTQRAAETAFQQQLREVFADDL